MVVVGAGSAGAVVAARLAEAAVPVLLLEAGPDHRAAATPPELAGPNFLAACTGRYCWSGLDGRRTPQQPARPYLRGRVVGGCSAVNAMVGMWGLPEDYAGWPAALRWPETAAVRAEIERRLPLWRPDRAAFSPIEAALATAALDAGHPWCEDHNTAAVGVGPAALTVRDGRRVSTNDGYLEPQRAGPYLTVRGGAEVASVLLEGRRAVGVRLVDGAEVEASRVVLAGGAIGSPLVLLRSGIARPGIGAGLADHPSAPVTFLLRPPGRLDHADRYLVSSVLRYSSGMLGDRDRDEGRRPGRGDDVADMQVLTIAAVGAADADLAVAVSQVAVMRSFGRGRVSLDADGVAQLDFRLLDDERDRRRLRDGLRRLVALGRHRAVRALTEAMVLDDVAAADVDGLLADDVALDAWLAAHTGDYVHACGTCRMGAPDDPAAVVDGIDGSVHGYEALHVIDASVFPAVPRANTHYSAVLAAEVLTAGLLSNLP